MISLIEGLKDMIARGVLSESTCPDDFEWLEAAIKAEEPKPPMSGQSFKTLRMTNSVSLSNAARVMRVHVRSLRRWEAKGEPVPAECVERFVNWASQMSNYQPPVI